MGRLLFSRGKLAAYGNLGTFVGFSALCTVLVWPIFGSGYPPGVDTATFLHLGWVTKLAASGQLADPFQDPYWYGGFSYLVAYPPLGYGLVGIISFVTKIDLVHVYTVLLVLAYGGVATATYWMAMELGIRRWTAVLTGVLAATAYPVLSSVFLWGWFTSVLALPFGLASIILLERSLTRGKWQPAAWGGVCMALSILVHHMTGLALGLGMVGWFVFHSAAGVYSRRQVIAFSAVFVAATVLVVAPWGIPFGVHLADAGFRREVPGLWLPNLTIYRNHIVDSSLIGEYLYPSYLGITLLVLATAGTVYALVERRRLPGIAIILLVLAWFSMGANLNPLIRVYPFSGLDVARFHLFMAPLMAIMAGVLVDRSFGFLQMQWPVLTRRLSARQARLLGPSLVAAVIAAILVVPIIDAREAQGFMQPYRVNSSVSAAINWLAENPSPQGSTQDGVYSLGLWNWGSFIIPYLSDRRLIDGWHDEGASDVRKIRELRIMGWTGEVEIERAHQLLLELGARQVLVDRAPDYRSEASDVFWEEFEAHPGFLKQEQWGDVAVFSILP